MNPTRHPLLPLLLADVPASLKRALDQEGICWRPYVPGAGGGRFVVFDTRLGAPPAIDPQQLALDADLLRDSFTFDPFEAMDDTRSQRSSWRIGPWEASEEVACVDKCFVRSQLMSRLRSMIEAGGGVWARLAAFPYPYRSAFHFRLDYDAYCAEDFDAVLSTIAGSDQAFSHFVCASDFQSQPEALARLRGRDVGSHGYWHHTYDDESSNRRNIARGIEALRAAGLDPSGFAAPHGRFNRGLLNVLAELGVSHSSEFGLAFDDLPFFPDGRNVLQIPVHPVCLGIVLEAAQREGASPRAAADAVSSHFRAIAAAKYDSGEPVFLYGHPDGRLGRHPHVLSELLETIDGFAAVWRTTLSEFAAWWRARLSVKWQVVQEGDHYLVLVHERPKSYRLGIEYCRGEHIAPMPLDDRAMRFSPVALAFQKRTPRHTPVRMRVDGPADLRTRVRRYLDWEKVTPVEAIAAGSLRGWMKRTLRRLRT